MAPTRFNMKTTLASALSLSSLFGTWAAATDTETLFHSDMYPCPGSCDEFLGQDKWSVYSSSERLAVCNEPVLLTFGTFTSPVGPVRACTAGNDLSNVNALSGITFDLMGLPSSDAVPESERRRRRRQATSESASPVCETASTTTKASAQIAHWDSTSSTDSSNSSHIITALQHAQEYLADDANCDQTLVYGYYKTALVGIYVGYKIQNKAAVNGPLVEQLLDILAKSDSSPGRHIAQVCGSGRNSDHVFGIVTDDAGDIDWVRQAVQSWTKAKCVNVNEASWTRDVKDIPLAQLPESFTTSASLTELSTNDKNLDRRALCDRIQVISGDGCGTLASRCGIHGDDFMTYNPQPGLCANLQEGQWVCCSPGTLPPPPTQGSDGKCVSYTVTSTDWCAKIAASHFITVADLYTFNRQTWGWGGCNSIHPGDRICVSTGTPPMPAPIANAVCGPQKPGSSEPGPGQTLVDLNPCKLNACCNVWGQCGITADFCIPTESETGNPGTALPGTNGCVQNCGMDIVNNETPSPRWRTVAYFESWNSNRPCLHMDIRSIDPVKYNTIHFAFLDITPDLHITVPTSAQTDWNHFKTMIEFKRIASFGGWAFSTEQATMQRLRDAVKPQNRQVFAQRCVDFMNLHNLDGLDFDWEYPASPDLPGSEVIEGQYYLDFLTVLRDKMAGSKTLSFAAPASYWYLRGFPVAEMAEIVDYVIYMTYDLHGQWDYGSPWAQEGCPAGNCLRSHVNMTTTINTLAMITKAGVPAWKIIVGITSYGRSFKMTDPNCIYEDHCTYTGPLSGALPGRCTGEAGYLAQAEIDEIAIQKPSPLTRRWSDAREAKSTYMIYNSTEWVVYMNQAQKESRTEQYKDLQFGGVTDWAVDLQTFTPNNATSHLNYSDYIHCSNTVRYDRVEDIPVDGTVSKLCYVIYALESQSRFFRWGIQRFRELVTSQNYDSKFDIFAEAQVEKARDNLLAFSSTNGSTYFDCTIPEKVYCCTTCRQGLGYSESQCKYCVPMTTTDRDPVCVFTSPYGGENKFEYRNKSQPCPPDYSQRGIGTDQSVWWSIKPTVNWADLTETVEGATGVNASFITRGTNQLKSIASESPGYRYSCSVSPYQPNCLNKHHWYNTLSVDPSYEAEDVPNPKTVIRDHLYLWSDTIDDIYEITRELRQGRYRLGDQTGRVDPRNYPIFINPMVSLLNHSLTNMEEIMKIADEIARQKKIEFALLWVELVATIVPLMAPWAAFTWGARFAARNIVKNGIMWGSELASKGVAIYQIIDDPQRTPSIIFQLMFFGALTTVGVANYARSTVSRMDAGFFGALGGLGYVPHQKMIAFLEWQQLPEYTPTLPPNLPIYGRDVSWEGLDGSDSSLVFN